MGERIFKEDFPLLKKQQIRYLDNAATTQKPQVVLDAMSEFYTSYNANPMRGMYELSIAATDAYESARNTVKDFIHAKESEEVVFTRNASESLNLIAGILSAKTKEGEAYLKEGDEILVATSEHHSNLLPWKAAAKRTNAVVHFLDCDEAGAFDIDHLRQALTPKTKVFAIAQISNVFGRENPIRKFAEICHANRTLLVVDATQSVPHIPVDALALDADFLVFSGHKLYGPMGVGVMYGKKELLKELPPYLEGGEMIDYVSKEKTIYAPLPHKYEAGTVSAADAYGLKAAIEYVESIGWETIMQRELELTKRALEGMKKIPGIRVLGSSDAKEHHGILTFTVDDVHPHDIAAIFADERICIRAGHHCAQPLHILLGIPSTARASVSFYNTTEDVDRFLEVLSTIRTRMGY